MLINRIKKHIVKDKKRLIAVFFSVFIIGLITHGFIFSNFFLSHDALNEFYLFGPINYYDYSVVIHKVSLGRFFAPIYDIVFRGSVASPWLVGILSLLWIALSIYFVCLLFNINSKLEIGIISAIFLTNLSLVSEIGSFMNDLDSYAFALLLAVLSVYFWNKGKFMLIPSLICLVLMLGIYQSMLSVMITLVIFISIRKLLNNEEYKKDVIDGLLAIGIIVIGGLSYLVMVKISCKIMNTALLNGYNSLHNLWEKQDISKVGLLIETYTMFFRYIIEQPTIITKSVSIALQTIALLSILISIVLVLVKTEISKINKVLIVLLIVAMPFGMNLSYFSNNGIMHDLMKYAIWFIYFFLLLLVKHITSLSNVNRSSLMYCFAVGLIIIISWANVKTANAAYTKKELEYQQTLSLMTRVVERMETTEGYIPGETPVAFIGRLDFEKRDYFADLYNINGQKYLSTISSENYIACYFDYVLHRPLNIVNARIRDEIAEMDEVKEMSYFPDVTCIKMINGTLVVKMNPDYY